MTLSSTPTWRFNSSLDWFAFCKCWNYGSIIFLLQLRAFTITNNRIRFQHYIRKIDETYVEILKNADPEIQKIVAKYTKRARTLTKFNFFMGIIISLFFCCYPFFTTTRSLPYSVWIPGVDVLKSPVYEIIFGLEVSAAFILLES